MNRYSKFQSFCASKTSADVGPFCKILHREDARNLLMKKGITLSLFKIGCSKKSLIFQYENTFAMVLPLNT